MTFTYNLLSNIQIQSVDKLKLYNQIRKRQRKKRENGIHLGYQKNGVQSGTNERFSDCQKI